MSGFWAAVAKLAVRAAIYAAGHPDQVATIITAVKEAKAPQSAAPKG